MVFDKTKAMRNAERFLSQGKIHSAIGELKQVVAHDPKDFGTMNMLGDLYTKNLEKKHAVDCYTSVAEHYSKQGFAQKAIAIYNKISKIQPNSIEINAKLADLYKFKGSVNEARSHYTTVAEHYESTGQKVEALEVRKQIASLDPNDTAICLDLAAAYLAEGQSDDAADAFAEAGSRFANKSKHNEALEAFEKALELKPTETKILAVFAQSHFALGSAEAAAERLAQVQSTESNDSEFLQLVIDCHLEAGNTADAEKAVIRLVEIEPASYPKFLDLARLYLKSSDAESASRITAIASEHLFLAGETDELQSLIDEILKLEPEQLEGLRLRARLSAWQRDEVGMLDALVQLAVVAQERESIDDERFALAQLVMIAPHEVQYAERLREIKEQYGFDDEYAADSLFDKQFNRVPDQDEAEQDSFAIVSPVDTFGDVSPVIEADEEADWDAASVADLEMIDGALDHGESSAVEAADETDEERLVREVDSIKFYIDSGYYELAGKAIGELRGEFGEQAEIDDLGKYLAIHQASAVDESEPETAKVVEAPAPPAQHVGNGRGFGIDDLRSELGLDEVESIDDSDYDTHYHTAVAYQEMGLIDDAIKEFQEAVGLVQANDPTRRFFHCANLLGHCFMQKAMPNLALTWYQRALETPSLSDEEKQGIWYELAAAYEAEGDTENAGRYFEQVYAENIDFRDVSERVKNITVGR